MHIPQRSLPRAMGFVDDYLGGYENLHYDSDGQPDFEAS
jgi:hypothetical protein